MTALEQRRTSPSTQADAPSRPRATAPSRGPWLTDTLIVAVAVHIAQLFRFTADASVLSVGGVAFDYVAVSAVLVVVWSGSLVAFHSYDPRIMGVGEDEYRRVLVSSVSAFGGIAIVAFMLQIDIARGYLVIALPLGALALCANRRIWRGWLARRRRAGEYLARVLLVGSVDDVAFTAAALRSSPGAGFAVAAVATDTSPAMSANGDELPARVSDIAGAAEAAANLRVDAVVIAGELPGGRTALRSLGWDLERVGIELVVSSPLIGVDQLRVRHRPVGTLPLMHVELPEYFGTRRTIKRVFDAVAAGVGLVVLLPVFAVIASMIKAEDGGPVFFRQTRVGQNGARFSIVKFRTMDVRAEAMKAELAAQNEGAGPLFKLRDDPRVTPVGRFLRRFSLDELPQLWNVLVGDMSLVGPRPALPDETSEYERHEDRRLLVRPGITGLWQVSGRSDLSWEQGVGLDLDYVENWTLLRDVVILVRTASAVIRPTGAY
ncbi:sugar transferase [Leifsonia sp. Le1]|uniref:sugar transferase n=1 Tax=Leifsonia sp. Le1 TaxID=3404918 RepID=UPI003EBF42EB